MGKFWFGSYPASQHVLPQSFLTCIAQKQSDLLKTFRQCTQHGLTSACPLPHFHIRLLLLVRRQELARRLSTPLSQDPSHGTILLQQSRLCCSLANVKPRLTLRIQENILRLEIPVNDAMLVKVLQRQKNLATNKSSTHESRQACGIAGQNNEWKHNGSHTPQKSPSNRQQYAVESASSRSLSRPS